MDVGGPRGGRARAAELYSVWLRLMSERKRAKRGRLTSVCSSVAPDPDSNLNSSLISIPDSGKLGSGKILCYQALDLIQVADLIQVKKPESG